MGTGRLCYNRAGLRWGRSDQVVTAEGQAGWQVGKEAGWGEGRGVKSREPAVGLLHPALLWPASLLRHLPAWTIL